MHILAAILAVVLGGAFWIYRLRTARDATETLVEAANDVRLAARRFGFRRKTNLPVGAGAPVEDIEDARATLRRILRQGSPQDDGSEPLRLP
jgi:predicted NUDIX family NTP pyrophosphohydrolase